MPQIALSLHFALLLPLFAFAEDVTPLDSSNAPKEAKELPSYPTAEDVTPAMKESFLTQLKAAIAHQDPRQFAELMDLDRKPDLAWVKKMMTQAGPYYAIFSDSPRKYRSVDMPLANGAISKMDGGMENAFLATTLEVTFNFTSPHTNGSNKGYLPLILKRNGKLLIVDILTVTH